MAKDARGHGSDTGTRGMRLVKTHALGPHSAKVYKNPEWSENVVKFFHNGAYQPNADYHTNDMGDAHATAGAALNRYMAQDAAKTLSSGGSKSAAAPVHESMSDDQWGSHNAMYGNRASDDNNRFHPRPPGGDFASRLVSGLGRRGKIRK